MNLWATKKTLSTPLLAILGGQQHTHTHTDQWKNLHRKNMNMIGVTCASMTTSNLILYLNSVSCIQISALSFHQEPRLRNQSIYCQIHKKSFDVLIKWDSLIILLSVSPLKVISRLRFLCSYRRVKCYRLSRCVFSVFSYLDDCRSCFVTKVGGFLCNRNPTKQTLSSSLKGRSPALRG